MSMIDNFCKYANYKKNILLRNFDPVSGSDERQYNSGQQSLTLGQFARTPYKEYKEYHTSGDTKKFMNIFQVKKIKRNF